MSKLMPAPVRLSVTSKLAPAPILTPSTVADPLNPTVPDRDAPLGSTTSSALMNTTSHCFFFTHLSTSATTTRALHSALCNFMRSCATLPASCPSVFFTPDQQRVQVPRKSHGRPGTQC